MSLVHAAGLARLQEEKLLEGHRAPHSRVSPVLNPYSPSPTPVPLPNPNLSLSPSPPKSPPLPVRRLIPEELASRRERGLCFYCDERFTQGHRCASRFSLLVTDKEQPSESPNPKIATPYPLSADPTRTDPLINLNSTQTKPDSPPDPLLAQISFHTLSGQIAPKTLRMVGRIAHHPIIILVDGGSTHNFVQQCLVESFGLLAQDTPTLRVLVGNGKEVQSSHVCRDVVVQVQGRVFMVDLHVLPLCGADVVLGVQWFKSLGPVLTNYNILTMKFIYDGTLIELKGDSDVPLTAISPPQLHRLT